MLGTELKKIREREGLSQGEVARRSKGELSAAAVSRIEAGERQPTVDTLRILAPILRLRVTISPGGIVLTSTRRRKA